MCLFPLPVLGSYEILQLISLWWNFSTNMRDNVLQVCIYNDISASLCGDTWWYNVHGVHTIHLFVYDNDISSLYVCHNQWYEITKKCWIFCYSHVLLFQQIAEFWIISCRHKYTYVNYTSFRFNHFYDIIISGINMFMYHSMECKKQCPSPGEVWMSKLSYTLLVCMVSVTNHQDFVHLIVLNLLLSHHCLIRV